MLELICTLYSIITKKYYTTAGVPSRPRINPPVLINVVFLLFRALTTRPWQASVTIPKADRQCNSSLVDRGGSVSCSVTKRKAAEFSLEHECKDKGLVAEEAGDEKSVVTAKTEREISTNACSKEGSKVSEAPKTNYIHVRARRGQATDSHSLAERARREKISKKMKCLQDLVPSCNKVTGKAGILDEIINYVQSLQKQVEVLSMKLAVSNPHLDFSVDDFFTKEKRRMAESSEGEEEGKLTGGNQELVVDEDLREMAKKSAWSVSSCKPGNGVFSLRDDNLDTYWQSDGTQPHLVNIQFQMKVKLQLVVLYVDFKLDESYTPSKISIRAGDGFHNLKEIKAVELVKPTGWVYISLSGSDPRETFVNTFMLQIAVLSNHLNGRDTHVRQIKVYGPRPNPIPQQPFQFTSTEFITYSILR